MFLVKMLINFLKLINNNFYNKLPNFNKLKNHFMFILNEKFSIL